MRGLIALDLDGTVTCEAFCLEKEVNDFLSTLVVQGWQLLFVTGRSFSFAYPLLSQFSVPFFFAVQNGAALYEMPAKRLIKKCYLSTTVLSNMPQYLLVESGEEQGDRCFYCPAYFSEKEREYLDFRIRVDPEKWVPLSSFDELAISEFAMGKCLGDRQKITLFTQQVAQFSDLSVIVIRDPFHSGRHVAFVNAKQASKGMIFDTVRHFYASDFPTIAAGDDFNDRDMLEKSSFKIVMQNAPKPLHALADLLAPPACQQGIIQALKEAIRRCERKNYH